MNLITGKGPFCHPKDCLPPAALPHLRSEDTRSMDLTRGATSATFNDINSVTACGRGLN